MVQTNQQHVAPCVQVVEWGLGTRGLGMLAAFWAGIPVEATQETSVVPRLQTCFHQVTLLVASYDTQGIGGRILPPTHRGNTICYIYRILRDLAIYQKIIHIL